MTSLRHDMADVDIEKLKNDPNVIKTREGNIDVYKVKGSYVDRRGSSKQQNEFAQKEYRVNPDGSVKVITRDTYLTYRDSAGDERYSVYDSDVRTYQGNQLVEHQWSSLKGIGRGFETGSAKYDVAGNTQAYSAGTEINKPGATYYKDNVAQFTLPKPSSTPQTKTKPQTETMTGIPRLYQTPTGKAIYRYGDDVAPVGSKLITEDEFKNIRQSDFISTKYKSPEILIKDPNAYYLNIDTAEAQKLGNQAVLGKQLGTKIAKDQSIKTFEKKKATIKSNLEMSATPSNLIFEDVLNMKSNIDKISSRVTGKPYIESSIVSQAVANKQLRQYFTDEKKALEQSKELNRLQSSKLGGLGMELTETGEMYSRGGTLSRFKSLGYLTTGSALTSTQTAIQNPFKTAGVVGAFAVMPAATSATIGGGLLATSLGSKVFIEKEPLFVAGSKISGEALPYLAGGVIATGGIYGTKLGLREGGFIKDTRIRTQFIKIDKSSGLTAKGLKPEEISLTLLESEYKGYNLKNRDKNILVDLTGTRDVSLSPTLKKSMSLNKQAIFQFNKKGQLKDIISLGGTEAADLGMTATSAPTSIVPKSTPKPFSKDIEYAIPRKGFTREIIKDSLLNEMYLKPKKDLSGWDIGYDVYPYVTPKKVDVKPTFAFKKGRIKVEKSLAFEKAYPRGKIQPDELLTADYFIGKAIKPRQLNPEAKLALRGLRKGLKNKDQLKLYQSDPITSVVLGAKEIFKPKEPSLKITGGRKPIISTRWKTPVRFNFKPTLFPGGGLINEPKQKPDIYPTIRTANMNDQDLRTRGGLKIPTINLRPKTEQPTLKTIAITSTKQITAQKPILKTLQIQSQTPDFKFPTINVPEPGKPKKPIVPFGFKFPGFVDSPLAKTYKKGRSKRNYMTTLTLLDREFGNIVVKRSQGLFSGGEAFRGRKARIKKTKARSKKASKRRKKRIYK